MMVYGRNETAAKMRQLTERPRNLALTGPLMSIMVNALLALVAITGIVAAAEGLRAGPTIVFGAMIWSVTHTLLVRAKQSGNAPPDERERVVNANAMAVGAWVTSSLLGMWFLLVAAFADDGMWYPDAQLEWRALGFFILGLTSQVTNMAAAWMTPAYAVELNPDD